MKTTELKELLKEKNLLEFNRDISSTHTEKMRKSIVDCGILRYPVIGDVSAFDKKRKFVIVDGQHLCNAIVKEGTFKDVPVITKVYESKRDVINDISKLNNTQKGWNDENYLDAWYKYGRDNEFFSNYAYLYNQYNEVFDGLPCGFLVDLYANSKNDFREGTLQFRNRELSDKLANLCYELQSIYNKSSFALHGLRIWVFNRVKDKKEINWKKLSSRLNRAIRKGDDKSCQGREDFRDFVQETYSRL
tara:strand:+ start:860 stop:1600 length:741 start_codon:yes stop_codon:yes gene_type:complete